MHKKEEHHPRTLEGSFSYILEKSKEHPLSINQILTILSGRGKPLLLIFLSLPFCQPLQIPGLSIPFGIVITLISLRMIINKGIWLPKFLKRKKISHKTLQKILKTGLWLITKIKKFSHSRLTWTCDLPTFRILNGILLVLWGVYMVIPIPLPLTNIIAGWAILFMGLGLLHHDGIFVIANYIITAGFILFITYFAVPLLAKI